MMEFNVEDADLDAPQSPPPEPASVAETSTLPPAKPPAVSDVEPKSNIVEELTKLLISPAPVAENNVAKNKEEPGIIGNDKMSNAVGRENKNFYKRPSLRNPTRMNIREEMIPSLHIPKDMQRPQSQFTRKPFSRFSVHSELRFGETKQRAHHSKGYNLILPPAQNQQRFYAPPASLQRPLLPTPQLPAMLHYPKTQSVHRSINKNNLGRSIQFQKMKHEMNNILRCNDLDRSIFRLPENCNSIEMRNQIDDLRKLINALPFKSYQDFEVILELIISTAMDEPTDAYALLFPCHELMYSSTILPQLEQKDRLFLLKMRCKKQFDHCLAHEQALADIQECTNMKRKKNILIEYHEQHARYRGKMIGIIRLMSEFFIFDESLKTELFIEYFQKLVDWKSETTLRCLCVFLVTTVDNEFYNAASEEFFDIFTKMKAITQNGIISDSLRNMISMVFKMKEHHWMNVDFKYYEMLKETDYETYKIEKILSFVTEVNKTCSNPENPVSEEDLNTEDLYSKVGCALDDLPYLNLNTVVSQITTLPIDTLHRLEGVVDLVFEKAVNEPNYSAKYAAMCRELALMQVPLDDGTEEVVNFRKLLIAKCQMELEKNYNEELNRIERLKEIEECTDQERKKELMFILEEDVIKIRLKSVGSVKFIGVLFNQQMLTVNILMMSLQNLIDKKDEERLKCLCELLTAIYKTVINRKIDLDKIFYAVTVLVGKNSNCNISSCVRFMLQNITDFNSCKRLSVRTDTIKETNVKAKKDGWNNEEERDGGVGLNYRSCSGVPMRGTAASYKRPKEDKSVSQQFLNNRVLGSAIQRNSLPTLGTLNMHGAVKKYTYKHNYLSPMSMSALQQTIGAAQRRRQPAPQQVAGHLPQNEDLKK